MIDHCGINYLDNSPKIWGSITSKIINQQTQFPDPGCSHHPDSILSAWGGFIPKEKTLYIEISSQKIWLKKNIPSGNDQQFAIEYGPFIVDLPIKDGDFL